MIGICDAGRGGAIGEAQVERVVEDELRDRARRACRLLALEVLDLARLREVRLGMPLGEGRDADLLEPALAQQRDEIGGMRDLGAARLDAGRQVAAQRDDVRDARLAVAVCELCDLRARAAHAGEVRGRREPLPREVEHRLHGALAGRAARAEGHADELRLERPQQLGSLLQARGQLGRLRREELERRADAQAVVVQPLDRRQPALEQGGGDGPHPGFAGRSGVSAHASGSSLGAVLLPEL